MERSGLCDDEDGGLIGGAQGNRAGTQCSGSRSERSRKGAQKEMPARALRMQRTLRRRKPADFVEIINAANQE